MKYAHILQAFYGEPWHLLPEAWRTYHELLQRAVAGQEIAPVLARERIPYSGAPADERPIVGPLDPDTRTPLVEQMVVIGKLAVIPVHGPLGRRLTLLDLVCGGCDYLYLSQFAQLAADDDDVEGVVFDFDSPGGQAAGFVECAAEIAALTRSKVTMAYTAATCASAAFGLASQCGEIAAAAGARVGSLGTIICGEDDSAAWAQQGRKLELFTTSPLKAVGIEGKPWTDQDREYLRERLEQSDAVFKSVIRDGRPAMDDDAYNGAWYFADIPPGAPGSSGLSVGLVDNIAPTLEGIVAAMA